MVSGLLPAEGDADALACPAHRCSTSALVSGMLGNTAEGGASRQHPSRSPSGRSSPPGCSSQDTASAPRTRQRSFPGSLLICSARGASDAAEYSAQRSATHISDAHLVTLRPSARQCAGSRFSCLQSIKSSALGTSQSCLPPFSLSLSPPLTAWQCAPMKNAADLSGAEVAPISSTAGTLDGSGFGSMYGVSSKLAWR